jgi:hypothetical protein
MNRVRSFGNAMAIVVLLYLAVVMTAIAFE